MDGIKLLLLKERGSPAPPVRRNANDSPVSASATGGLLLDSVPNGRLGNSNMGQKVNVHPSLVGSASNSIGKVAIPMRRLKRPQPTLLENLTDSELVLRRRIHQDQVILVCDTVDLISVVVPQVDSKRNPVVCRVVVLIRGIC